MAMALLFVLCSWLSVEVLKLNIYSCWAVITAWGQSDGHRLLASLFARQVA